MYFATALTVVLPPLAAAQAQKPIGEQASAWFQKAKSYIPNSGNIPAAAKDPIGASAAKVAAADVTFLNMSNYESFLTPDQSSMKSPQEYMVYIHGGNKTCAGKCTQVEKAWNESAVILGADPTAPKLGYINCENQGALCAAWMAKPPTIWHIQQPIPHADQSKPDSTVYINYLNITTTTAGDIVALHTGKKYETGILLETSFHPFNGIFAQYGLAKVVGYVLFAFGMVPSWAFMLVISLVTRTWISRRNGPNPEAARARAAQGSGGQQRSPPLGGAPPANE